MGLRLTKPRNRAFSLLEVVFVVALLSIGMTAIIRAFSFSARVAGYSCDMIAASFFAEDIFQELEFSERRAKINEQPSEGLFRRGKFEGRYTIIPVPDWSICRLELVVKWLRANKEETIEFNTYLRT